MDLDFFVVKGTPSWIRIPQGRYESVTRDGVTAAGEVVLASVQTILAVGNALMLSILDQVHILSVYECI